MKCIHCKAELKDGCVFCSCCGKEVQIVPDYNEFDDEYLNDLVTGNISADNEPVKVNRAKKNNRVVEQQRNKIKLLLLLTAMFIFAIIIGGYALSLQIKNNNAHSYDYQVKQANKAVEQGQIDIAIDYYENALLLEPDDIELRFLLGDLYLKGNNNKKAEQYYSEIIQFEPNSFEAFKALLSIYENQNNLDKILKLKDIAITDKEKKLFADYVVDIPEFDKQEGKYSNFIDLCLKTKDRDSVIYYTIDGKNPVIEGILYQNPIRLDEEKTYEIQAVCVNSKKIYSDIIKKIYTIYIDAPKMPEVSPDGGSFVSETTILVHVPRNCQAYYTWNGSDPDINSMKYQGDIRVPEGNNVLSVVLYDINTQKYSEIYRGRFEYYMNE